MTTGKRPNGKASKPVRRGVGDNKRENPAWAQ